MRIELDRRARADIRAIRDYIARDNPAAAERVIRSIRDQVRMLADQPGLGRPGRIEGTRELVMAPLPYIACYTLDAEAVIVLRVLHGARRWPLGV